MLVIDELYQIVRTTEGFYDTAFSLKATSVATQTSLPKNFHVAKEAVSAAWQTKTRHRSGQWRKTKRCSNDEAAALRKNHVRRPARNQPASIRTRQQRIVRNCCPRPRFRFCSGRSPAGHRDQRRGIGSSRPSRQSRQPVGADCPVGIHRQRRRW